MNARKYLENLASQGASSGNSLGVIIEIVIKAVNKKATLDSEQQLVASGWIRTIAPSKTKPCSQIEIMVFAGQIATYINTCHA